MRTSSQTSFAGRCSATSNCWWKLGSSARSGRGADRPYEHGSVPPSGAALPPSLALRPARCPSCGRGGYTLTRFTNLAEQWGQVLATHHARADKDADPSVISYSFDSEVNSITNGDHAGFRALVRALAVDYANQVAYDYASFCANL